MYFSKDNTVLYLRFKNKPAQYILACLKLIENILILSNSYRNDLLAQDLLTKHRNRRRSKLSKKYKGKVSKKFNKTDRIRVGIDRLVNKEGVHEETIDDLVSLIRQGRIERVATCLKNQVIIVSANTDFDQLLVDFLLSKDVA